MHFYFNRYIKKHKILDVQLQQSIDDVIRVYPDPPELGRWTSVKQDQSSMSEDEGIEYLVSISRILKPCEQNLLRKTEDKIKDMDEP